MESIDNNNLNNEGARAEPPPIPDTVQEVSPQIQTRLRWWERIIAYFSNHEIESQEAINRVQNDGNPITIFVDRYIYKRHCPYCYAYVSRRIYRVQSSPGRNIRASSVSMSRPILKTYECPSCEAKLPADFFSSRSSSIALVGGVESGKSSFITVFCELLLNKQSLLGELGIFGSIVNPEGRQQFQENRWMLIEQSTALRGTAEMEVPILVRLQSKHHSKVTYITFIDSPGEHFEQIEVLLERHPNLQYADGILFLMNPLDIDAMAKIIESETPGSVPPIERRRRIRNFDIVENLYQLFVRTQRIKPNARIQVPTVFCLSRADLLEKTSSLYIPKDFEPDLIELEDIVEEMKLVSEDMRTLLEETDINLLNLMDKAFKRYNIFPVSPLGSSPILDGGRQKILKGIRPKGVLHPFIWILKESKFITTQ